MTAQPGLEPDQWSSGINTTALLSKASFAFSSQPWFRKEHFRVGAYHKRENSVIFRMWISPFQESQATYVRIDESGKVLQQWPGYDVPLSR